MKARVRADAPLPVIRSAGLMWSAKEWRDVPAWAEREICANPYLETDTEQIKVTQPQTIEDQATRLVEQSPGGRKGRRKL